MHEAAFSKAALPAPARVLGLNLKPYSLGHELWLIREQNPLSISVGGTSMNALANALPMAALFCSQSFSEICAMNRDRFIGPKLWLWNRRIRKCNSPQELAKFLEYRTQGALTFPNEEPSGQQRGRTPGAPILLSMFNFIRKQVPTDSAAWDYPYGLAQMRYAEALEQEGSYRIKNQFETQHDKEFAEWEKANPQSGLEELNA